MFILSKRSVAGVLWLLCVNAGCVRKLEALTIAEETPVTPAVAQLTPAVGFRPKEGFAPTRIELRGTLLAGASVLFTGSAQALTSTCEPVAEGESLDRLCVEVPADASSGPVQVLLPSGESLPAPSTFEVLTAPEITDLAPADGFGRLVKNPASHLAVPSCDYTLTLGEDAPCLRVLELSGDNFDAATPSNNRVQVGGVPAEIAEALGVTRTHLFVRVPDGAGDDPVSIETPAGSARSATALDLPGAPALIGVSPLTTFYNELVVLRGTGFDLSTFGNNVVSIESMQGGTLLSKRATPFAITATTVSFLMPELELDEVLPGERLLAGFRLRTPKGEAVLAQAITLIGPPAIDVLTVDNGRLDELIGVAPAALAPSSGLVARGAVLPIGHAATGEQFLVKAYGGEVCEDTQAPLREKLGSKIVLCGQNFDQADNMRVSFGGETVTATALSATSTACAAGSIGLELLLPQNASSTRLRLTTLSGQIDQELSDVAYWPAATVARVYPLRAVGDQVVLISGEHFIDHPKAQAVVLRSTSGDACARVLYVRNQNEIAVRLPANAEPGARLVIKHSAGETEVPEFRVGAGPGQLASDATMLSAWVSRASIVGASPGLSGADADVAGVTASEESAVPLAVQNKFAELFDAVISTDGATIWASQRGATSTEVATGTEATTPCADLSGLATSAGLVKIDIASRTSTAFAQAFLCGVNLNLVLSDDGSTLAAFHKKEATWPRTTGAQTAHQVYFFDAASGMPKPLAFFDPVPDATPSDFMDMGELSQVFDLRSSDGAHWQAIVRSTSGWRIFDVDVEDARGTPLTAPWPLGCASAGAATSAMSADATPFGTLYAMPAPMSCTFLAAFDHVAPPTTTTLGLNVFALDATRTSVIQASAGTTVDVYALPSGPFSNVNVSGFRTDATELTHRMQEGATLYRTYNNVTAGGTQELAATGLRTIDLGAFPASVTISDRVVGMALARVHDLFSTAAAVAPTTATPRRSRTARDTQGALRLLHKFEHSDGMMDTERNADVAITTLQGTSGVMDLSPVLDGGEKAQAIAFSALGTLYAGTTEGRLFRRPAGAASATLAASLTDPIAAIAPWPEQPASRGALIIQRKADDTILSWWREDGTSSTPITLSTCTPSPCPASLPQFPAAAIAYVPQWDGYLLKHEDGANFFSLVRIGGRDLDVRRYRLAPLGNTQATLSAIAMMGDRAALFLGVVHADAAKDLGFFAALPEAPPSDDTAWAAVAWRDPSTLVDANARMQEPPSDSAGGQPLRFSGTKAFSVLNGRALISQAGPVYLRPHDYANERPQWRSKPGIAQSDGTPLLRCVFGARLPSLTGSRPYPFGCLHADMVAMSDNFYVSASGRRAYMFALERPVQPEAGPPPQQGSFCLHGLSFDQGQLGMFNAGYCGTALGASDPVLYQSMGGAPVDCATQRSACKPEPWAAAMSPLGDELVYGSDDGRVITLR